MDNYFADPYDNIRKGFERGRRAQGLTTNNTIAQTQKSEKETSFTDMIERSWLDAMRNN